MLDWNDLSFVLALHRCGTLAGAARVLHVEHSTVSRRIAVLEKQLGTPLFTRRREGYTLTPAGRRALSVLERIAEHVAEVERRVGGDDIRLEGPVRLTAPETFASGFLVPRLRAFRERYPKISLVVLESDQALDLSRREADVAIRMFKPKQPNLIVRKVGELSFAVFGSRAYAARRGPLCSDGLLGGHDVIGFSDWLGDSRAGRWLAAAECGARVVSRCNTFSVALEMARAGLGLTVLPCCFGVPDPALQRFGPAEVARVEIWLAVHSDVQRNARIRALTGFLTQLIARAAPRLLAS